MSLFKNIAYVVGKKLMSIAVTGEILENKSYIENRIMQWLASPLRRDQINGDRYYRGDHDILKKKRTVIGKDGEIKEVKNLPNNRKVDNQYARMVDQKKNYLLAQPITFNSKNQAYVDILNKIFNKKFKKTLKDVGEDCLNGGVAWVYPYYNNNELKFKNFPAHEILPFWNDKAHTELNMAVRLYVEEKPDAINEFDTVQKVEIYTKNGVYFYTFENNRLEPDTQKPHENYMTVGENGYNWEHIPLIAFKANSKEIPLIRKCKSIQDGINEIISTFKNNLDEDTRNTILVLENYDGQDLGDFREKLSQYGVIKTRSGDGARGDVRTLTVQVDHNNYESVLRMYKKAMFENCKGYDFTELRSNNDSPSQMNIKCVFADIDLDANDMIAEFNASFEDLLWFVNQYCSHKGLGDFSMENVDIIFNKDMLVNEVETLMSLVSAGVHISNKTLLEQVPFINSSEDELKQLKKEREEEIDVYEGALPQRGDDDNLQDNE